MADPIPSVPQKTPLFTLSDACLGHGATPVLQGIDLTIGTGERVAVLGNSGAGKSTLLHALYAQQPMLAALCPQELGLVPSLSVFHNMFMGRLHRYHWTYNLANLIRPMARQRLQARAIAEKLRLEAHLDRSVDRLSGGQAQRTAVARAIFSGRPIFLGDEPLAAIDPALSQQIMAFLQHHFETLVVSLHDVPLALRWFDRIIGLQDGRLVLDAPAASLSAGQVHRLYALET